MSTAGRPPTCSIIKGRFAINTFAKRPWTTPWTRCWTSSSASSPAGNNQRTDPQESYSGDSPDFVRQKEQIESVEVGHRGAGSDSVTKLQFALHIILPIP